jgi:hypothetical protein
MIFERRLLFSLPFLKMAASNTNKITVTNDTVTIEGDNAALVQIITDKNADPTELSQQMQDGMKKAMEALPKTDNQHIVIKGKRFAGMFQIITK